MLTVTVTNADGYPIPNLKRDAFMVLDNKEPQKIGFFYAQDTPASVGILFDMSPSMFYDASKLNAAIKGVWQFIQQSNKANKYFVVGFQGQPELLIDWTSDANAILDVLNKLGSFRQSKDGAALYDACLFGIEKLKQNSNMKSILLLISHGNDNSSHHQANEVQHGLKGSSVAVYSLGLMNPALDIYAGYDSDIHTPVNHRTPAAQKIYASYGRGLLEGLSSSSGGKAFFPLEVAEFPKIFARLALQLRHQYVVGFYPANLKDDGKWHTIKVSVKPVQTRDESKPDRPVVTMTPKVRTREGYYAPKP